MFERISNLLLDILTKFEKQGGLLGLVYASIFLLLAYLISKFGETDGLMGMVFSGTVLLIGYLIKQQADTNKRLFTMIDRNDDRLIDLKKSLYKAQGVKLQERRKLKNLVKATEEKRKDE